MKRIFTSLLATAAMINGASYLHAENTQDYYQEEKEFDEEHHINESNLPNPKTEQGQLELWHEAQDSRDDLRDIYPDPKARHQRYMRNHNQQNNNQQSRATNDQNNQSQDNRNGSQASDEGSY